MKSLTPGNLKSRKLEVKLPPGTTLAGRYVIAVVNSGAAFSEITTANNDVPYGPLP